MIQQILQWLSHKPDWKNPIYLEYRDNILTITTLDGNIQQYVPNTVQDKIHWKKRLNKNKLLSEEDNKHINIIYQSLVQRRNSKEGGWVKSLR